MIATLNSPGLAEVALQRNGMYGLLSLVFSREPTLEFLRKVRGDEIYKVIAEMGVDLGESFTKRPEEELLLDLTIEYTRLFIGPDKHLSPHESVYAAPYGVSGGAGAKGLLWGEATVQVKELIKDFGLSFINTFKGIPDHLGIELQTLYSLTNAEQKAWSCGDERLAKDYLTKEERFLFEHVCRWVPQFCNLIMQQANEKFYSGMAKLTKDFLLLDLEHVAELLNG